MEPFVNCKALCTHEQLLLCSQAFLGLAPVESAECSEQEQSVFFPPGKEHKRQSSS